MVAIIPLETSRDCCSSLGVASNGMCLARLERSRAGELGNETRGALGRSRAATPTQHRNRTIEPHNRIRSTSLSVIWRPAAAMYSFRISSKQVMHWHFVLLPAFFVESQPPARAIVIVIIDPEFQYCADPGETVRASRQ